MYHFGFFLYYLVANWDFSSKPLNLSLECPEARINTGDLEHERFWQPLTQPLNNLSCDFNNYIN